VTARDFRTSDFDYELPDGLIAQSPLERRDESRLMIVRRADDSIEHAHFRDLAALPVAGDVMVLNTTRVIRARLLGKRPSGAPGEVLLLHPVSPDEREWEAMVSPGGKLRPGRTLNIAPGFTVQIREMTERRTRIVRLLSDDPPREAIARHGHVPLPPYISRGDVPQDAERYQTVYARQEGSVAAPTAGLHFTPPLLDAIAARGVKRADVVLHVGAGTFKPVEVENPDLHEMHEEHYEIDEDAAAAINGARSSGGAAWAVGTTSLRAIESAADEAGIVHAGSANTRLFIRPGYRVRAVDKLITNFHLPRSTLLMLVAAFAGYDLVMRAYAVAIQENYRFYSYGDAMVIL
jgi:S-adenosylmethionine:tRNA ribosyltransferase-isomerase